MKNLKTQQGITLIALIITIVVLLILAVVAIGAVQDSNIVGYAQNAAGGYDSAKANEIDALSGYENILSQYANGISGTGSLGESNTSVGNLGKYVKYDSNGDGSVSDETILWRVLRDDADKVELITADVLGNVDLTPADFNDARNKYNRAVELMVTECERVTGIENNIRSIGGTVVDTTDTVVFENLQYFQPSEGVDFSQYEGENGFKVGDNNYEEDKNQMIIAGVYKADNSKEYWFASRYSDVASTVESSRIVFFGMRAGYTSGGDSGGNLCGVSCDGNANYYSNTCSRGVRPVLTLSGGILEGKTGAGTKDNPIEIY